ncbi:MAG: tetratricopeptide repeat protein [Pseudomonadota bacterium]|mgnify:CR=1 FL=1|nr:hypothetical protein [Pseudomonadales bacterium]MDY6918768.1 tetratricopeptide repeat protein [Pseudomonadota bacterium]
MRFTSHLLVPALVLVLGGCALGQKGSGESEDFTMPESVSIDLGEPVATPPDKQEPAAATAPEATGPEASAPETEGTPPPPADSAGIQDADSAAVLRRLQQGEPVTRDPAQVKQAELARSDFNRAIASMRNNDLDQAMARFQDLAMQYPALAGPIVNQAIILRKKGQLQEAYDLLQNSLLQHGKNPRLLNELGIISRRLGKFRQARVSYESAIRIDAAYATAHYNLAVLADLYLHDPELALKEFKQYQALIPEPDKTVGRWIIELERRAERAP